MSFSLEPSPLESARFSIQAGKLQIDNVDDVPKILPGMHELGLNFVSARIPASEISLVQALQKVGFFLTDTLVYYKGKLTPEDHLHVVNQYAIREATHEDHEQIINIAKHCFTNYSGHYHADPCFDSKLADEVYIDWTKRSCLEKFQTDVLLVSEENKEVTSFITLKKSDASAQAMIGGVHPEHQNKGLYRDLIRATKKWALKLNCREIIYSTQITNLSVQKVWAQEGSHFFQSYYTLHFWLPE